MLFSLLGLAHSLSRYKLKFSPDKVDTMIVQAVSLLDDIDKELNNYNMRCREWYGWHFPELGKIITDHTAYAKVGIISRFTVLNRDGEPRLDVQKFPKLIPWSVSKILKDGQEGVKEYFILF